jgi:hypothetical protein
MLQAGASGTEEGEEGEGGEGEEDWTMLNTILM